MQASHRHSAIDAFLAANGWEGAKRTMLAGDASFRKYERVYLGDKRAVLMDAPPDKEDVRPFMRAGDKLVACGLSAPKLLAHDESQGFLLLEDLGDDLFARVLSQSAESEADLYHAAGDVLAALYRKGEQAFYPGMAQYDLSRYLPQVSLLCEWFMPHVVGKEKAASLLPEYLKLWEQVLAQLPELGKVMVLYDYHAENLLWLPDRKDVQRVGLLDFQDAVIGSPAYDMVSFLEDARRDVTPATVASTIDHYLAQTKLPRAEFMLAYALLGAQRNTRIVGTFVRLAQRDGKKQYLNFMPRVWGHLERDVSHPALKPLKDWMDAHVPAQWRGVLDLHAKAST